MTKRMFNKYNAVDMKNQHVVQLDRLLSEAARTYFCKAKALGLDVRDAQLMGIEIINMVGAEEILKDAVKLRRAERLEKGA